MLRLAGVIIALTLSLNHGASAADTAVPVTQGLQLWLKADAGVATNSSGVVTGWADQSGQGNHAAPPADPAKAPTVEMNTLNGKPTLRFGGGTRYLDVANSAGIASLTQDVTILTLVKYDDVSDGLRCPLAKTVGNLAAPFDWYNAGSGDGRTEFFLGNGLPQYGYLQSTAKSSAGVYNIVGGSWGKGIIDLYLNDFHNGHGAYTVTPSDGGGPLRIGARADLASQLKGNLAEVLIYKPALSAADRTAVIAYLRTKYALKFNRQPVISIQSPAAGSSVDAQAGFPLRIDASDPDGTVARVDLLCNGNQVASWTNPPFAMDAASLLTPGKAVLTAVAVDNLGLPTTSAPISLTVTGTEMYRFDASAVSNHVQSSRMKLGANRNPQGEELGINSFHLTRNGKPWIPVMGEFHYARYPRDKWEESILKMKAGGIQVVASYVFGIIHQESEGQWDWTGNKDLRAFIQLCAKHGLYVWLRPGPWCNGECRNGGYPDWLLPRLAGPKVNDPILRKYSKQVYQQVYKQSEGLLFKDGGPVIGLQLDNETNQGDYLMWLKKLAFAVGLDVPYYTQTAWAGPQVPPNEIIPVWGGYPDAPWSGGSHYLVPANQYTFTGTTADAARDYDFNTYRNMLDKGFWLTPGVPYATVEMGTGNQIRYSRRPRFAKGDIDAMQYVVIGKGANILGYYMYHGGSHPVGKLTTLESKWQYPMISYDFLAALGEYGKPQPYYHSLRVLHMFLQDFGEELAPMYPVLPSRWQKSPADTDTLRCTVRVNVDSGFIFFNNYHRGMPMKDLGPIQFNVKMRSEVLSVPQNPLVIKADTYAIWPLNQRLGEALLKYATAQPLCRLSVEGGLHYFFKATDGVAPEFVFDSQTVTGVECPEAKVVASGARTTVSGVQPGTESTITLKTRNGQLVRITTLSSEEAEQCYKATVWGRERVLLSAANLMFDGKQMDMLYCGREKADESVVAMGMIKAGGEEELSTFAVYPAAGTGLLASQKPISGFKDGIFTRYKVSAPCREIKVKYEALPDADLQLRETALAGAQWIWSDANNTDTTMQYFRREFTVAAGAKIKRATLAYCAANHLKLWMGGQLVDEGGSAAMVPPFIDVTDRVHAGRNVIAAAVETPLGFGGWLCRIALDYEDGKSQVIMTDSSWKSAKTEQKEWVTAGFDDQAWAAAVKIADQGGKHWTNVPRNWYEPVRKAFRIQLPAQVPDELNDVMLRIKYVGDVAFLTESYNGRLLADNFYNQPLWEIGLKHYSAESLRGGVVLWITPLKKDAQIYMPEENRPKFAGAEVAELRDIVAVPEYRVVVTAPGPAR